MCAHRAYKIAQLALAPAGFTAKDESALEGGAKGKGAKAGNGSPPIGHGMDAMDDVHGMDDDIHMHAMEKVYMHGMDAHVYDEELGVIGSDSVHAYARLLARGSPRSDAHAARLGHTPGRGHVHETSMNDGYEPALAALQAHAHFQPGLARAADSTVHGVGRAYHATASDGHAAGRAHVHERFAQLGSDLNEEDHIRYRARGQSPSSAHAPAFEAPVSAAATLGAHGVASVGLGGGAVGAGGNNAISGVPGWTNTKLMV